MADAPEKQSSSCLRLVCINVAVLIVLLLAIEVGYRAFIPGVSLSGQPSVMYMQYSPYVMFTNGPNTHYERWENLFGKEPIKADVTANNYGYTVRNDFDITRPYKKAPNEKVVLFSGGSTAWGVGASTNEKMTYARLEEFLNAAQKDVHYTVVNLAMGGWIAQQQVIALDLWGRLYHPDWVVTLDGANDASVGCAMSQGTGYPAHYQIMKSYLDGYLLSQDNPSFYRGYLENLLVKYSAAYRGVTHKQYIPQNQTYDNGFADVKMRVITPTPLSDLRNELAFYILSEESILERFQDAKYLLTTQPWQQEFDFVFGTFYGITDPIARAKAEEAHVEMIDKWLDSYNPTQTQCSNARSNIALRYVLGLSAIKLHQLVEQYRQSHRRDVEYYNTGLLFPKKTKDRENYFADTAHLNDLGQEVLARFYAYNILLRDFPTRDWSKLRPPELQFQ